MAWLSGWSKRIKITVDSTKVDSALSNFPVLLHLSTSSGIGDVDVSAIFDEIGSNSLKIAVTQSDGSTECYVEIEKWDSGNEEAWLWVKAPSLASSSDTDFYIYYDSTHADNTSYIGGTGSTPGETVWDSNFTHVFHMRDNTTSTVLDSTSNSNDGTKKATNEPIEATGKISDAQDFDGSNDYISATSPYDTRDSVTLETIVKLGQNGVVQRIISIEDYNDDDPQYFVRVTADDYAQVFGRGHNSDSTSTVTDNVSLNDSNFHHIAGTINGNTGSSELFVDSVSKGNTTTSQFTLANIFNLYIGLFRNTGYDVQPFDGIIDEIRISDIIRSAAWIKATYYTCWDTLVTFGTEEISIPAFSAVSSLLSILSINLSSPVLPGQGTLSSGPVVLGFYISCVPFTATSLLASNLKMSLATASFDSPSILSGVTNVQLLPPAFSHQGTLSLADIFIGQYVSAGPLISASSLNALISISLANPVFQGQSNILFVPSLHLLCPPFDAVASLLMASINKFNIESAEIYYTFVLTGANDGVADAIIPIANFQARLRSGDPTYLSVTVSGKDYAAAISARPNGEMVVYMHYYSDGLRLQTEEIIRVDLEDINISEGPKSTSIVLTGHKTTTTGGKTVTLRNPTYRNLYKGKYTYRCATPDIFLKPGDTIICGDDTFDVDYITYVVSVAQQSMEITGT